MKTGAPCRAGGGVGPVPVRVMLLYRPENPGPGYCRSARERSPRSGRFPKRRRKREGGWVRPLTDPRHESRSTGPPPLDHALGNKLARARHKMGTIGLLAPFRREKPALFSCTNQLGKGLRPSGRRKVVIRKSAEREVFVKRTARNPPQ